MLCRAAPCRRRRYRVDCQLLQYLHHENALGYRFPIGKVDQVRCGGSQGACQGELLGRSFGSCAGPPVWAAWSLRTGQRMHAPPAVHCGWRPPHDDLMMTTSCAHAQVEKWDRSQIMEFWARNYFPANATVYVVGDVEPAATRELVQRAFGRVPLAADKTGGRAPGQVWESCLGRGLVGAAVSVGEGVAACVVCTMEQALALALSAPGVACLRGSAERRSVLAAC